MEAQEVANLPDFVKIESREKKPSAQELLDQIKRKEELSRVNQKFGANYSVEKTPSTVSKQESIDEDQLLNMKTQDFFDEAERQILKRPSNPLNLKSEETDNSMANDESTKLDNNDVSGQRELDDDEFEDELNGGNAMVQMNWKISDSLQNDRSGKS